MSYKLLIMSKSKSTDHMINDESCMMWVASELELLTETESFLEDKIYDV